MMDNCNLTAYGLYPPELCKGFTRDFSEDYAKKALEDQKELLDELERICSAIRSHPAHELGAVKNQKWSERHGSERHYLHDGEH